ncbi:hypothetical protein ACTORR_01325 [Pseudomonas sp. SAR267]|uniref:hypothetical protein n=1 Tax=Pseudomonas sp. SAR267 TaxID=3454502 RepID=UPI003F90B390
MEVKSVDVSTRGIPPHEDTDIVIALDSADVGTLKNDAVRAALAAFLTANIPVVGIVVAAYVEQRIDQIIAGSGPNGCLVGVTIRDGVDLHVFTVTPQ